MIFSAGSSIPGRTATDFSVLNRNVCRKSFFTATINNHTIFIRRSNIKIAST